MDKEICNKNVIIYLVKQKKQGLVKLNGVHLEPHEYETILFLTNHGFNLELIPPSHIPNTKTPDFLLDGVAWEAKAPHNRGKMTIQRAFYAATAQSENIIFDLRNLNQKDSKIAFEELKKRFLSSKKAKKMKIITKTGNLLDF